ncbi:MAG: hypothetical protein Q7S00_03970, partial [bacterium]|nr:hypothetical protein [bacterium]
MKTLTFLKKGCLLLLILTMLGCGQMSSPVNVSPLTKDDDNQDVNIDPALIGGTNTGSSIDETAVESPVTISSPLALKIEATGSAIIPKIGTSSSTTSSLVLSGLSYNTDDHWSIFFEPYYDYTLPYIFGPLDQKWVAETQLRYLLKHFTENPFVELLDYDPSGCAWHDPPEEEDEGQYGPWSLAEDDWITIAFFGDVSNGTKEDRFFDCAAAGPTYYNEGQPDQSDVY